MITPLPLLQNVRVASPCDADWDGMSAVDGERVRFCAGCQKNVYNLSAMSPSEAEGLLRKHEGRLCIRYFQRQDGTVLTGDCPVGAQRVRLNLIRRSMVAAALFALLFVAMGGKASAHPLEEDVTVPSPTKAPSNTHTLPSGKANATKGDDRPKTLHVTLGRFSRPPQALMGARAPLPPVTRKPQPKKPAVPKKASGKRLVRPQEPTI